MTLKELEKKWETLRKDIPAKVTAVTGTDLPHVSLCRNFIPLAGRMIALSEFPEGALTGNEALENARGDVMRILYLEMPAAKESLRPDIINMSATEKQKALIMMRTELFTRFYNNLTQAYVNLMTVEASMGCVRVPVLLNHLYQDAKVKSHYGEYNVSYSPVMHEVPLTGADAIEQTARLFATAYIKEEPMSVITVKCNKAIRPRDYLLVQSVISEFCELANVYAQEEFEEKKNDEEYQHRFDDDPLKF